MENPSESSEGVGEDELFEKGGFVGIKELWDRIGPKHEDWQDVAIEAVGVAATVGRYAVTALPMARRAREGKNIFVHGVAAVGFDVGDGVATREVSQKVFGREAEDTPLRRIIDGVLDQATVIQVGIEVAKRNPSARPYLGALALRSMVAGGWLNGFHIATTGEVTKGRRYQKITNLTAAAFGIAAATGNRKATHATGIIATAVAWGTAPAHLKQLRQRRGRVFREL
jgi:hypothetical protein